MKYHVIFIMLFVLGLAPLQAQDWSIVYHYQSNGNEPLFRPENSFMEKLMEASYHKELTGYDHQIGKQIKKPNSPLTKEVLRKRFQLPYNDSNEFKDDKTDSWGGVEEANPSSPKDLFVDVFFASQLGLATTFKITEKKLKPTSVFNLFIPEEFTPNGIQTEIAAYSYKATKKALKKSDVIPWVNLDNHAQQLPWLKSLKQRALVPLKIAIYRGEERIVLFKKEKGKVVASWENEKNEAIDLPDYVSKWVKWESQEPTQKSPYHKTIFTNTQYHLSDSTNEVLYDGKGKLAAFIIEGVKSGELPAYNSMETEMEAIFGDKLSTEGFKGNLLIPSDDTTSTDEFKPTYFRWETTHKNTLSNDIKSQAIGYRLVIPGNFLPTGIDISVASFKPEELLAFLKKKGQEDMVNFLMKDQYIGWRMFVAQDIWRNEYYQDFESNYDNDDSLPTDFKNNSQKLFERLK